MLQTLKTMLPKAREEQRCVLAVNVYNLETIQATLEASMEKKAPIILAFGESYLRHANTRQIVGMITSSSYFSCLDVVIHLDHARSEESIKQALESGFTSVMYDGSHLPLRENIDATKEIVKLAGAYGASVEAELGYLNNEDGSSGTIILDRYTRVLDALMFVEETNVDALALAIGNAHGLYKGVPHLDFNRLQEISQAIETPLVLHGASGIPAEQIKKAIMLGIAKINVNTEVALSGARAIKQMIDAQPKVRLEQLMLAARDEMKDTVKRYLDFIGY
jgi:fructose-bisphosphate aldolase class II